MMRRAYAPSICAEHMHNGRIRIMHVRTDGLTQKSYSPRNESCVGNACEKTGPHA